MSGLLQPTLKPGVQFALKKQAYEVTFADAVSLRYASCEGGRPHTMPTQTFWELVDQSVVGFLSGEHGVPLTTNHQCRLSHMTEPQRLEMLRRYGYVKGILTTDRKPLSRKNLQRVIATISGSTNDAFPPACSTLAKWVKRYVCSGGDVTALVPRHDRKGSRYKQFPLDVEKVISRSIRDDFLTKERPTVKQIHCNVIGRILEDQPSIKEDLLPSTRTIHRRIKELDPYIRDLKRYGKQYADKRHRAAGASLEPSRLMEIVMIDGHKMDVLVIDGDTGEVLGRPFAVCLFDVFTRCVVGWHISLLPFCATTALAAIKDMCSRNPTDGPGGIPEGILPDNGPDLSSDALRNLCGKLPMHIHPAKAYSPDDKAHLERFFRTLNEQLIHLLPGTTFSSPTERRDYDSKAEAKLTLDQIKTLFSRWLDEVYHVHIHSATNRAPSLYWRDQQAQLPIISFPREDIEAIARVGYRRQITNGRVIVDGLAYKSDALVTLERRKQRDVTVLVDELDLSHVYVQQESDPKILIRATAVRIQYTKNLTKYEHQEIQKRLKAMADKDLKELGLHAYEIARWRLWCDIHKLSNSYSARQLKLLTNGRGRKKTAKRQAAAVGKHGAPPSPRESGYDDAIDVDEVGESPMGDSPTNHLLPAPQCEETEKVALPSMEFEVFEL